MAAPPPGSLFLYTVFPEIVEISRAEKTGGWTQRRGYQLQDQVLGLAFLSAVGSALEYSAGNFPATSLPQGPGWLGLEAGCGMVAIVRSLSSRHPSPAGVGTPAE